MKYIKLLSALLATAGCVWNGSAQSATQLLTDTIPYELRGSKIVISTSLNGKPADFIVDTGGRNILVADSASHYDFTATGTQTVGDVNLSNMSLVSGIAPSLRLGSWMNWDAASFLAIPNNNYYRSLGVAGALGGEAFSAVCLTIDGAIGCLVVTYPYRPAGVPRSKGIDMDMGDHNYARVPMNVGGVEIPVLFDTGMTGFLSIGEGDRARLLAAEAIRIDHRGYGFTAVGAAGFAGTRRDSLYHVNIPYIELGGKRFENAGNIIENRPGSIMGRDALDYGKVIIDYPRGLFFFFPYDSATIDMRESTLTWNVRILPVGYTFEVTAAMCDTGVSAGERVWSIAGRSLSDVPPSEMEIEMILDDIDGDTAEITVGERPESARVVIIRKI